MTAMLDVMVDLETLGQRPGCAILSIGAVAFDPVFGRFGEKFYTVVSRDSCKVWALDEDADTLAWWERQSPEARAVIAEAEGQDAIVLNIALQRFADYLSRQGGPRSVRVWGNGADFDNAILAHLYARLDMPLPWAFWNSRCFRTLKNLGIVCDKPEREGTYHNALDDARHQAEHACAIFAAMRPPQP